MAVERGPILVWGAGAIGGTIGAHLVRAGEDVTFVDRDRDHVAAIAGRPRHHRPDGRIHRPGEGVHGGSAPGPLRAGLPLRQGPGYGRCLARLLPHLTEDGYVVSAQNGLNELTIAKILGEVRTMGCFVNFGADYMEPGVIHYAAAAPSSSARSTAKRRRASRRCINCCASSRSARADRNIWGYLWGKLAYGAMLFATALTDASIADCLASERHRRLFIALAREVAGRGGRAQGQARGLRRLRSRAPSARASARPRRCSSLDHLVAFNRRSAKTHSGIWRDLAVRKRSTEIEAQLRPGGRARPPARRADAADRPAHRADPRYRGLDAGPWAGRPWIS